MGKVFGDNHEGFAEEKAIIDYINKTVNYEKFNSTFKMFLTFLFNTKCDGKTFSARKGKSHSKTDVVIIMGGTEKNVSLKTGQSNSVHQEPISQFKAFIKSIGVPDDIVDKVLKFHYSDGTSDGTGLIREGAKAYSKSHQADIKEINKYFNNKAILRSILTRAISTGAAVKGEDADAVYHGTLNNGKWASIEEIITFLLNKHINSSDTVHASSLTYQAWNKNLKRNPNTENRRHVSQFKWASAYADLKAIFDKRFGATKATTTIGTIEGDVHENDCVSLFNTNKNSKIFKDYLKNLGLTDRNNLYLVRITTKQYSRLSDQVVMTRADAYCINSCDYKLSELIHRNNGYLDEKMLTENDIIFQKIANSGISIKMDSSDNYQILKMTPNSFYKIFKSHALGAGASLFCTKDSDLVKNKSLIEGWGSSLQEMQQYFSALGLGSSFYLNIDDCKRVKKAASDTIASLIDSNKTIQQQVFNGIGFYDEPYTARFFFRKGCLSILTILPYTISTGSGRSKGIYSLVLKP